jgi:hypothetical protein
MRALRILLALPFVLVVLWAFSDHQRGYHHFITKEPAYYRQFANACDSLLVQQATGQNLNEIEIQSNDQSLPKIISDIHPETIRIHTNRVFIGVLKGGGFAVFWSKADRGTNLWDLRAYSARDQKTLYESTKP